MRALAFVFLAACVSPTDDTAAPPDADPVPIDAPPPTAATIFELQHPDSRFAAGTRVRLDDDAILRVTAISAGSVWLQDVESSGFCEHAGDRERVAFHAIRVDAAAPTLTRGQHVRVEGDVVEADGRRTLANVTIKPGAPDAPYRVHCERDGARLKDAALEAVLVQTAGQPAGEPDRNGPWSLAPCFSPASTLAISPAMFPSAPSAYQWVTGVIDHTAAGNAIVPRDADDVFAAGDDACL